jgi:glycosyltransferase involved in cell wall biosynthesis
MIKILHTISSANPQGGGPIEGINRLGTTLETMGHRVEIASLDPPGAPFLGQSPLTIHPLGPTLSGYGLSTRFIPWLRANCHRYDAVIVNGIWQFHSLGVRLALRNTRTPYVVFTHGMLDPWFKKRYPLKHLKKWMYWPWAEYRVLRDARAVLFTCEEERVLARQSFWLYRCNEVVVGYGTNRPTVDFEACRKEFLFRFPELQGKRVALFLGRIHPKKGCDLLIKAFAKVLASDPSWHLVFAGPDQTGWQKKLARIAKSLGVASRITWTGMVSGAMKWGAIQSSEVFVLPSHQENFGIAVAEALAAGLPALVTNKVNIWREIEASGAGLVAGDSLNGVCSLLQTYTELSPGAKSKMRGRAQQCFEENFEIKKAAQSLHKILVDVIEAKPQNFPREERPSSSSSILQGLSGKFRQAADVKPESSRASD